MWAAKQGLDALVVTWNEGANAKISSSDIWDDLRRASQKDGVVAKSRGDIAKTLGQSEIIEAAYELPFLAHAPMEPMNCTVQVSSDACEIWVGSQVLSRAQSAAAGAAGPPGGKGTPHTHPPGGG